MVQELGEKVVNPVAEERILDSLNLGGHLWEIREEEERFEGSRKTEERKLEEEWQMVTSKR